MRRAIIGVAICAACVGTARADDEAWIFGRRPSAWIVQAEPMVWFAAIGGDLRVGAGGTKIRAEDVNVDGPRATPAGEIHLRDDALTFTLSAFGFEAEKRATTAAPFTAGGLAFAAGAGVRSGVDVTGGMLAGGYRLWQGSPDPDWSEGSGEAPEVLFRLDVYGGARFHSARVFFENAAGARAEESTLLAHPLIGAKFQVEMFEKTSFDVAVDYGLWPGSRRSSAFGVTAGVQWRPWGNVGVQFGWRGEFLRLRTGSLEIDGSLQGLFGSIVLRY